ncbi:MAG TPA: hypothetical protein VK633_11505 [Verrucomicrobiae bacterium]|nr:hypothetical protein [Verrucomicrobiae bacterium]
MMAEEFVPFGGGVYLALLGCLVGARGMDFLSTWVATPNLVLEANPIAKKMGWRIGLLINAIICCVFAVWPLPSIVIVTTSLLVAARNFQGAWLMRSLGEHEYRFWMSERLSETPRSLFLLCLVAQTSLVALLGGALMFFAQRQLIPFGVGMGMITYGFAILVYSLLSVWRARKRQL